MDPNTRTTPYPPGASADLAALSSAITGAIGPSTGRSTPATVDDRSNRPRPSLLVVDDEPEVLDSVYNLLRLKYRVVTCTSGTRALELLRSDAELHVIMSDQRMPEMTGVELLRQAKEIRPETTRLLFTAYADIRTVIDAINQGHVFRYLAKPWDSEELEAVVYQAVEHHDLIVEKNRLLAELQAANAKLTEANRLKGAFIEVASHELNTPVTVVLGLLELWKMSLSPDAQPADRQWVDRIGAAAQRLARTVERMLKLVRSGEFGRALEKEMVAIESLVRRTIDEVAPYLELRRQSVSVQVEPDLASILVDRDKLTDVLVSLVANAIKFTPDSGTIRIVAGEEPGMPGWVRVRVIDEGVGIAPEDQQYLFEPFFTGFDTLRHSSGDYQFGKRGIGLGLWLVKTFVELHGGRVEVSSTPGQGSTFSFLLPRNPEEFGGSMPDSADAPHLS
ncbi:MAG: ATP-binding protein [Isosphaeraceae bacterium]